LANFATLSNGQTIPNPRYLRRAERKLKRLHRRLSRSKQGSQGRENAHLALARHYEKVTHQRQDFQHKLSRQVVTHNRLVCLENLNVGGMIRNKKIAKSISDAAWGEFARQCSYKASWYGSMVEKVGRFFPSSRLCSECGEINPSLKLSERKWVGMGCGTVHHRDANASKNILAESLRWHTVGATGIDAGGEIVRPEWALPMQAAWLKPEAQGF
jgi:putative transposase